MNSKDGEEIHFIDRSGEADIYRQVRQAFENDPVVRGYGELLQKALAMSPVLEFVFNEGGMHTRYNAEDTARINKVLADFYHYREETYPLLNFPERSFYH